MDKTDAQTENDADNRVNIPDPFARRLMVRYLGRREADLQSLARGRRTLGIQIRLWRWFSTQRAAGFLRPESAGLAAVSGLDVLRKLRDELHDTTPGLALTASDIRKLDSEDFNDSLRKPVQMPRLLAQIQSHIR